MSRYGLVLHACPTCGAEEGKPCRTLKGRKKVRMHINRSFSIQITNNRVV